MARCTGKTAEDPEPASAEPADRLLTVQNVADYCQLSARTVMRRIEGGELAAFRIGGRWRIARRDLELFLRERWCG